MWDKFGELDSAEEINRLAAAELQEGDIDALKVLAEENGLDKDDVEDYIDGLIDTLTTPELAAVGKLDVEMEHLDIKGILRDWVDELKAEIMRDREFAIAVRRKGKSLAGYIALTAETGYTNRAVVHKEIVAKTTTIKNMIGSHEFSIGIPTRTERKQLMHTYYEGGVD